MGAGGDGSGADGRLPRRERPGPRGPGRRVFDHRARRIGADHGAGGQGAVPVGGGRAGPAPLRRLRPARTRPSVSPTTRRTRAITAIAIDDDGAAWVAGAMGIGRWVAARRRPALRAQRHAGHGDGAGGAPADRDRRALGGRSGRPLSSRRPHLPQRRRPARRCGVVDRPRRRRQERLGRHARATACIAPRVTAPRRCRVASAIVVDAVLGVAKTAAGTRARCGERRRRGAPLRVDQGGRRRIPRRARSGGGRAGRIAAATRR